MSSGHAGGAIHAMRTAMDLSGRGLAAQAGVSAGYLSRVERGLAAPSAPWLRSVTDALGRHLAG